MKVFLLLMILVAGDPEPIRGSVEVKDYNACLALAKKVGAAPPVENVTEVEITCKIVWGNPI